MKTTLRNSVASMSLNNSIYLNDEYGHIIHYEDGIIFSVTVVITLLAFWSPAYQYSLGKKFNHDPENYWNGLLMWYLRKVHEYLNMG